MKLTFCLAFTFVIVDFSVDKPCRPQKPLLIYAVYLTVYALYLTSYALYLTVYALYLTIYALYLTVYALYLIVNDWILTIV